MWTIFKKESLENILTMRFLIGFLACNLLFPVIMYVVTQDLRLEWDRLEAARYQEAQSREGIEVYSQLRLTVFKPLPHLGVFGSGLGRAYGNTVWISHTRIPVFTTDEFSGGSQANFLDFFYDLDFITVVQIFISLLAILFSFDSISGEKQNATLCLALANPVKRPLFFIAKFLGALAALSIVVCSSFFISGIVFITNSPVNLNTGDWIALSLILVVTILLGAVFVSIGMLISAFTHRTSSSLILGMIAWVFLALVIPSLVSFASTGLGFQEDQREFDENMLALYSDYNDRMNAITYIGRDYFMAWNCFRSIEGQVLIRFVGNNALKYFMGLLPDAVQAQFEFAEKRFGLESAHYAKRKAKAELAGSLMRVSPTSLYARVMNTLAGNNIAAHERFMERARRYRGEITAYIEGRNGFADKRWFTNDPGVGPHRAYLDLCESMTMEEMVGARQTFDSSTRWRWTSEAANDPNRRLDLGDLPRFKEAPQNLGDAISSALFDIFLMFVFIAATVSIAFARFLVYDPR